jgi:hypothetical protein
MGQKRIGGLGAIKWKGASFPSTPPGDHKGPPSHSSPPSPLRNPLLRVFHAGFAFYDEDNAFTDIRTMVGHAL